VCVRVCVCVCLHRYVCEHLNIAVLKKNILMPCGIVLVFVLLDRLMFNGKSIYFIRPWHDIVCLC